MREASVGSAVVVMAIVNIIWGVAFPITKPALADIPPFTFAAIRFMVALVFLLPLAGKRCWVLLRGPMRWRMVLLGLCGFTLVQLAQMIGLNLSPSADIALLATLSPLWITLLAWPMLGERPDSRSWLGFGLAIIGLALVVWPQDASIDMFAGDRLLGNAVYIVGTLFWALYNILGKDLMADHDPLGPTAAATLTGMVGLLPFALWELTSGQMFRITGMGIVAIGYTALLVTVFGFLALFWAYQRASAAQVAITMYLQPLAGVLVAWWWLGEALSAGFLIGAALVLVGVGFVTLRPQEIPKSQAA
jgi:drug/metabolite transporter (DMT)-like permease